MPEATQLVLIPKEPITGQLATIPLDAVDLNAHMLGGEPPTWLVQSVDHFGVLQPIVVLEIDGTAENGRKYKVVAGCNRIKSARAAGLTEIPANVLPYGARPFLPAMGLAENYQRQHSPTRDFEMIEELVKEGASEDQICQTIGTSEGILRNTCRLMSLIPLLAHAYKQGQINLTVARLCAKADREIQEECANILEDKGKLTVKDVEALLPKDTQQELPRHWADLAAEHGLHMLQNIPDDELALREDIEKLLERIKSYDPAKS